MIFACDERYSLAEILEEEVRVTQLTHHLLTTVAVPSQVIQYVLMSLGFKDFEKKEMFQLLSNLCMHEMWKNGSELSYFALAFSALLIYFELRHATQYLRQMVLLIHNEWESDFKYLCGEISLARKRLIEGGQQLTNDQQCRASLRFMGKYSFEQIYLDIVEPVPKGSSVKTANKSIIVEANLQIE